MADEGGEAALDILISGGPGGDTDSEGAAAGPDGGTEPALAFGLNGLEPSEGLLVGREGGEDLVEGDFVENLDVVKGEDGGKVACMAAAALDHFAEAGAAEGEKGGPGVDTAGAAGGFRGALHGFDFSAGIEVAGGESHSAGESLGIADEDDAAVIRDIEPFVAVGGPGIGGSIVGVRGPEAEGAIDMDPGIGLFGEGDEFGRIESAGVDVTGLETDEGGLGERGKGVGTHAALGIGGDADDTVAAETEHGEGFEDGDVGLLADEDRKGGSCKEA